MKTTLTVNEMNAKIDSFIALFKDGVEAWIKAGEILVDLVEADPHTYDYIIQKCPTLNAGILGRFEQMGRKTLHPQLLLTASPGFAKLQKLPFSMQERYIEEPIPLVVHTDDGTDILLVQAKNMTKEQAAQVFAGDRLRTDGEQKAWLMQQRSMNARPVNKQEAAWTIKAGRVIFREGTSLSAGELATILAQITK
jgi:hypothetical protein